MNLRLLIALNCLLLLGLTGCQTPGGALPAPGPGWQDRVAQLHYRSGDQSLIGEALIRTSPAGDLHLTFSKGPGLNLLTIHASPTMARAEGPLARLGWRGQPDRAPAHLRDWVLLQEVFAQMPSRSGSFSAPGRWEATLQAGNGALTQLLVRTTTGGQFNFQFTGS